MLFWTSRLDFKTGLQDWTSRLDFKSGPDIKTGLADWTSRLDLNTGLQDWTSRLDFKTDLNSTVTFQRTLGGDYKRGERGGVNPSPWGYRGVIVGSLHLNA